MLGYSLDQSLEKFIGRDLHVEHAELLRALLRRETYNWNACGMPKLTLCIKVEGPMLSNPLKISDS